MAIENEPTSKQFGIEDIEAISNMPETNAEEIKAKHQAYNDLIVRLGETVQTVHEESGSNSPDDESQEDAQEAQDLGLVRNAMERARTELARLGEKLQK